MVKRLTRLTVVLALAALLLAHQAGAAIIINITNPTGSFVDLTKWGSGIRVNAYPERLEDGNVDIVRVKITRNYISPPDTSLPGEIRVWDGSAWHLGESDSWQLTTDSGGNNYTWAPIYPGFLINGATYTVRSRIYDLSHHGYYDDPAAPYTFTYDDEDPTLNYSAVTSPTRTAPSITGTAHDIYTGIDRIEARFYYQSEDSAYHYWNGSIWETRYRPWPVNAPVEITGGNLRTPHEAVYWRFTPPALTSGITYYYNILTYDRAGNYVIGSTYSFLYDTTGPTVTLEKPSASGDNYVSFSSSDPVGTAKYNGATWSDRKLLLTASDESHSMSRVELSIRKAATPFYFNGTTWGSDPTSTVRATADTGDSYYYQLPVAFFDGVTSGNTINIIPTAYDSAGNPSTITGRSIIIDNGNPFASISTLTFFSVVPTSIEGTASDSVSYPKYVNLRISRNRDGVIRYWSRIWGSIYGWSTSPTLNTKTIYTSGSGTYRTWNYDASSIFNGIETQDIYTITAEAYDAAGNVQSSPTTKVVRYDPTAPNINITNPTRSFNELSDIAYISTIATDESSGIRSVKIQVMRNYTQYFDWFSNEWTTIDDPADTWHAASRASSTSNTYNFSPSSGHAAFLTTLTDGDYLFINAKSINAAGTENNAPTVYAIYDTTLPTNPRCSYSGTLWTNQTSPWLDENNHFALGEDPTPNGRASGLDNEYDCYLQNPDGSRSSTSIFFGRTAPAIMVPLEAGQGIYTLKAKSVDKAGNSAATYQDFPIGLDTTPPSGCSITSPISGSTIDTVTPTVCWTAASDALSGLRRYHVLIDGSLVGVCDNTSNSFDVPPSYLSNGPHNITIIAEDRAYNHASCTTSFTVRTQIAPQVMISSPADNSITNETSVNIQGTAVDDSNVNSLDLLINRDGYGVWSGSGPSVDFNLPVALAPNQVNSITIRATDDTALNGSATINITCDIDPPAAFNLISPANGGWGTAQPTFRWERSQDSLSGLRGYDLYVDDTKVNSTLITDESFASSSTLSEGEHTYYVKAWDNAGNTRSSDVFTFKVDSVAPSALSLTEPTEGAYKEAAFAVSWTQSADENSGLAAYDIYIDGEKKTDAAADATTITITDVPSDGTHNLYVEARDVAGNTTRSNAVNITTNPNAPAITLYINDKTIISGDKINSLPNIKAQITDISGVDPSSIKILFDGQVQGTAADLQAAQVQASSVTAYDARKNDVRLKSGKHSIRVEAKDVFGKEAVLEVTDLDVLGKAVIDGKPMNFPNPFRPSFGQNTSINYTLLDDADIKITLYDLSGRQVLVKVCNAGTEGGRFGENNVVWDGKSLYGEIQANGVYVYLIATTKGEVIGSGEIAIYE